MPAKATKATKVRKATGANTPWASKTRSRHFRRQSLKLVSPRPTPKKHTSRPGRENDSSLTKCFKVIAPISKVLPLEIVSPKYHLEWDTTAKGVTGPHWSENFFARLARIATHPI
ncbi:hypothetical protein ColLi_09565 [Colletotrichum liriopes]|uniref:Uncharacterized protein n=1 Tax=Colletotrichum liriopes TaxID=708192 RepID=A0AA37LW59_9PEZI|nr:hypothetical protein ColLi_09565 [Colletotrichum liriopes]